MAGPDRKLAFSFEHQPIQADGEPEHPMLRPLQNVQQSLKESVERINVMPWSTSRLCDPTTFTAFQTISIPHRLGRKPVRWTFEDVTGGYGAFQRVSWDEKFIVITSVDACTALFRVE